LPKQKVPEKVQVAIAFPHTNSLFSGLLYFLWIIFVNPVHTHTQTHTEFAEIQFPLSIGFFNEE